MAAIAATLNTLCAVGDEIVASTRLYGGTVTLLSAPLARQGIRTVWVNSDDPAAVEAAITARTKAVFLETIGNPKLTLPDLAGISEVAHRHGVPVVVDNTTASPALCRPIEHGVDIVVHSLTKYLGGHGNSIGGILVDGGTFPWTAGALPSSSTPTHPITICLSTRLLATSPLPCGHGSRRCAISARPSAPPMPS
jgi:O-acetylhomoserine (thiol)-lyase